MAVGRTYPGPPAVHALGPVDLVVQSGEYVAVMGPSGSGKSTLLNLLGLLDTPSAGRYLLDGIATDGWAAAHRTALRARKIGFVFQGFHLLPHRSTTENVALGQLYTGVSARERLQRARYALDRVGLAHRLETLPTRLSGGERQRVAIARALVNHPSLLLCDEPTGNLDSVTAAQVMDLIDEVHRDGVSILLITHDPLTALRAKRQLSVADGVIVADIRLPPDGTGGPAAAGAGHA
ncbi:MAG: ABC transporter ATP-binding protein [Phycicoccus sp.]|nr:ABC transporter ATP-binding protein [Phycicoccus sp.]